MVLDYICFDGAERNIFRNRVDELQGRGMSEILVNVGYSTVYGVDES